MSGPTNTISYKSSTLLAILAHPDDESYELGATLAKYSLLGTKVYYVSGTGGELGTAPPESMKGFSSVKDMRWHELKCAAKELGLARIFCLGYRDSGMAGSPENHHKNALCQQPIQEIAAKIAYFIRKIKPDVVITHDPIGGYFHPDHIAIHKATVMAFRRAGDSKLASIPQLVPYKPQKLYYNILSRRIIKLGVKILPLIGVDPKHFGKSKDIDLTKFAYVDFPVHAVIQVQGEPTRRKSQAIDSHKSQHWNSIKSRVIDTFFSIMPKHDMYMRAYPPVKGKLHEIDLFKEIYK